VKRPDVRDVLLFDDDGNSIGFRKDKDHTPEIRAAALDEMLRLQADRSWTDYLARLSAVSDEPLMVLGIKDEELVKMVNEGSATPEEYDAWRRATSSGLTPMLPSDVANELYDRFKARMKKGVDRTVCPEGMTDLEHARMVVANCGASGGSAGNLAGDEKALDLATKIRKREPGISGHALAKRIKTDGGSRVTVGERSLRAKIAAWEIAGKIPKKVAITDRKSKGGRKSE